MLGQKCGHFEPGREFDGLVIDPDVTDSPLDLFTLDTMEHVIHKFLYTGEDEHTCHCFQGNWVCGLPVLEDYAAAQ